MLMLLIIFATFSPLLMLLPFSAADYFFHYYWLLCPAAPFCRYFLYADMRHYYASIITHMPLYYYYMMPCHYYYIHAIRCHYAIFIDAGYWCRHFTFRHFHYASPCHCRYARRTGCRFSPFLAAIWCRDAAATPQERHYIRYIILPPPYMPTLIPSRRRLVFQRLLPLLLLCCWHAAPRRYVTCRRQPLDYYACYFITPLVTFTPMNMPACLIRRLIISCRRLRQRHALPIFTLRHILPRRRYATPCLPVAAPAIADAIFSFARRYAFADARHLLLLDMPYHYFAPRRQHAASAYWWCHATRARQDYTFAPAPLLMSLYSWLRAPMLPCFSALFDFRRLLAIWWCCCASARAARHRRRFIMPYDIIFQRRLRDCQPWCHAPCRCYCHFMPLRRSFVFMPPWYYGCCLRLRHWCYRIFTLYYAYASADCWLFRHAFMPPLRYRLRYFAAPYRFTPPLTLRRFAMVCRPCHITGDVYLRAMLRALPMRHASAMSFRADFRQMFIRRCYFDGRLAYAACAPMFRRRRLYAMPLLPRADAADAAARRDETAALCYAMMLIRRHRLRQILRCWYARCARDASASDAAACFRAAALLIWRLLLRVVMMLREGVTRAADATSERCYAYYSDFAPRAWWYAIADAGAVTLSVWCY